MCKGSRVLSFPMQPLYNYQNDYINSRFVDTYRITVMVYGLEPRATRKVVFSHMCI